MKNNKTNLAIFLVLVILSGILVLDPMIHQGIFTAHDITSNITYFGAFYNSLIEGNIIPRWAGNIANLYGSPTIMFFYPLSYYLSSFIRVLGFSLIDTTKIYIFITFIASALVMYLWLRNHVSRLSAFIGAFLYVYAPYRISDLYARGSVAENTAFVFIPLIAYMIYKVYEKPRIKRMIILTFSIAALILSHPFMLVIFIPFYLTYVFYNKKKILSIALAGFLSIGLTAFYLLPLLAENKYTHYDISAFNGSGYATQFINLEKLILPIWAFIDAKGNLEYQTYQAGVLQIVLFLVSLITLGFMIIKTERNKRKINYLYIIGLINFIVSIFLMLPISNIIYQLIPLIQQIEYPWRYLSLNLYSIAIMISCFFTLIKNYRLQKALTVIIIAGGLILYLPYSKGHDYKILSDDYYLYQIKQNTDMFATLPRWAAQPDIYQRVEKRYEVIEGNVEVKTLLRNSTRHIFSIEGNGISRIADTTFYFPGWKVMVDGKPEEIEFQDPSNRGIITFYVPSGKHQIEVSFQRTKLRIFADIITLLSLLIIIILWIYAEKIQKSIHRYSGI